MFLECTNLDNIICGNQRTVQNNEAVYDPFKEIISSLPHFLTLMSFQTLEFLSSVEKKNIYFEEQW